MQIDNICNVLNFIEMLGLVSKLGDLFAQEAGRSSHNTMPNHLCSSMRARTFLRMLDWSESKGYCRRCSFAKAAFSSGVSLLMPKTSAPFLVKDSYSSRNLQASLVQPGVPA